MMIIQAGATANQRMAVLATSRRTMSKNRRLLHRPPRLHHLHKRVSAPFHPNQTYELSSRVFFLQSRPGIFRSCRMPRQYACVLGMCIDMCRGSKHAYWTFTCAPLRPTGVRPCACRHLSIDMCIDMRTGMRVDMYPDMPTLNISLCLECA